MGQCDICKEDRKELRKCKDCNTIFCHWCMLGKDFNTDGQIIEIDPFCPKCKGENLIEIVS